METDTTSHTQAGAGSSSLNLVSIPLSAVDVQEGSRIQQRYR